MVQSSIFSWLKLHNVKNVCCLGQKCHDVDIFIQFVTDRNVSYHVIKLPWHSV